MEASMLMYDCPPQSAGKYSAFIQKRPYSSPRRKSTQQHELSVMSNAVSGFLFLLRNTDWSAASSAPPTMW
jgi:hypothetical protein